MDEINGRPHALRSGYFLDETEDRAPNFGMGGLKGRFAGGKMKRIGRNDPFAQKPVVLRFEVEYHNWLLRRLDPDVIDLAGAQEPWSAMHRGKIVAVQPSLHISWRDRPASLDFVISPNRRPSPRLLEDIQVIGRAHGVDTCIRSSADIHADPQVLCRYEWLLQRVCVFAKSNQLPRTLSQLNRLLAGTRLWTRATVISAIRHGSPHVDVGLIDAALLILRKEGKVRIDLVSSEYCDGSTIESNL